MFGASDFVMLGVSGVLSCVGVMAGCSEILVWFHHRYHVMGFRHWQQA